MENVIEHHGILGQKWGVRRYQNKDGSLTTAGKQRVKRQKDNPKKVGDMSDDELSKRISRLRMEETYVQLMANKKSRETGGFSKFLQTNGKKFLDQSADSVIRAFAENLGARIKKKSDDKKEDKKEDIPDFREMLKKDVSKIDPKYLSDLAKYCNSLVAVNSAKEKMNSKTEDKEKTDGKDKK